MGCLSRAWIEVWHAARALGFPSPRAPFEPLLLESKSQRSNTHVVSSIQRFAVTATNPVTNMSGL